MSNSNRSNKLVVPNAREAGSVGGQMVKKMIPVRTAKYARTDRAAVGHEVDIKYIAAITV